MEMVKYMYVDLYWRKGEEKQRNKKHKELIKLGYTLESEDTGVNEWDYCDQYLKYSKKSKLTI